MAMVGLYDPDGSTVIRHRHWLSFARHDTDGRSCEPGTGSDPASEAVGGAGSPSLNWDNGPSL